ncbi:MAG: cupredoxin domain-containing protein [Verrucomicrobiae bacterium]|nr:cupredoxin domain-containing protein [Verrucomicrobiae bacterium]
MKRTVATLALVTGLLVGQSASLFAEDAEITITADKVQLAYDTKEISVKAGQTVKLTLVNPADSQNLQPHNLILVKPGKLGAMIALVNDPANFSNPAWLTNPIPETDMILHHTKLLKPGESETLEFTAPAEEGDYPFLCSYIGHAAIMNGIMKVTK